jgi:hypothetical protein
MTIIGWKKIGRCKICRQTVYKKEDGVIVMHAENCPNRGTIKLW